MTVYRLVSILTGLFSLYTFVYNCVRVDANPPSHTLWALIHGAVGVAVFGAGVWWDRPWLRWGQLGMMCVVAFTSIALNDTPWTGLFFLCITLSVAYAYDVFDRYGWMKVGIGVAGVFLALLLIYKDFSKTLMTLIGFVAAVGLVGYILWDKLRRMRSTAREAAQIAREAIALVKQEGRR